MTEDHNSVVTMYQTEKVYKQQVPWKLEEFASQRSLAQYICVNTRPDICAAVQLIAPGSEPTSEKEMNDL